MERQFSDLNASIHRMATLADSSKIGKEITEDEVNQLKSQWQGHTINKLEKVLESYFSQRFFREN